MRMPSIQQVLIDARGALARFPAVLAAAAIATGSAVILVDREGSMTSSALLNVLYASILGFPLLLTCVLFAERRNWRTSLTWAMQAVAVVLLVGYAMTVPSTLVGTPFLHVQRLMMLMLAACLLVAYAPFAGFQQLNGFWHYGEFLVRRIILAAVFSLTLFTGLAVAMAAVDQLFGVDIPGKRYAELALTILGLFSTWLFLSGIPKTMDSLDTRTDYPRVLKVFGQHILSPLVLVYFVILYAYILKITIEWSWPKGMVSGLIFGFASMGITTVLLLYPIRDRSENRWIAAATRWFWIVMVPMVVVLQLAIWRRVSEYGVTENRYFAMGLGVWLTIMVVYFLINKTRNIKVLPASICVVAVLASFGPWSAFSVSENSQVGRLEELLARNNLLVDGQVQEAESELPPGDAAQINSIVWYLHRNHGLASIQPWFGDSLLVDSAGMPVPLDPASVFATLVIDNAVALALPGGKFGDLSLDPVGAVSIEGFEHMLVAQRFSSDAPGSHASGDGFSCRIDTNLDVLTLRVAPDGEAVDSIQVHLRQFVDSLIRTVSGVPGQSLPPEKMSVQAETATMRAKVVFRNIVFRRGEGTSNPTSYEVVLLYTLLPP